MSNPSPSHPPSHGSWMGLLAMILVVSGASQTWVWWQQRQAGEALRQLTGPLDIVMYTTSSCPYCAEARDWFKAERIPWRECNVENHARCRTSFNAQGAPGVPLMSVRGQWHLGFDRAWLALALQAPQPSVGIPDQAKPNLSKVPRP